jgi:hypothetical protein
MKNRLYLAGALASALTIFSFSSCEKESVENGIAQNQSLGNKVKSNSSKSGDPYAIYGSSHNSAMDYVADHSNFNNLTNEQVFDYLETYSDTDFDFSGSGSYSDHLNSLDYTDDLFSDIENAGTKLYNDGRIDSGMIDLAQRFFNVFDDAVPETGTPQISSEDFISDMEDFESYLLDNYTVVYNEDTKEGNFPAYLLAASSVAKSSYSYWENVAANPTHPWYDRQGDRDEDDGSGDLFGGWFGRAWHSIKTAAVDVGGFFGGCGQWSGCSGICFNFGVAWNCAGSQSAAY